MKYPHILHAVASMPWALYRDKMDAILEVIVMRAVGEKLDQAEIEARISETRAKEVRRQVGATAIIPIEGVLSQRMNMMADISGGTSTEALSAEFRAALADEKVKAIVLAVNSPGGSVFGLEELAAEIFEARGTKPVVAQVSSQAASAAYWLASQADEIVITPSGEAGSVGVYAVHDDLSARLEQEGVKRTLISDGKHKGEGASFQPLSDEAREHMQSRVKEYGDQFRADVARGRRTTPTNVRDTYGDGRVFGAKDLMKRGMVDRIGTLADTVSRFEGGIQPRRAAFASMRAAFGAGALPTFPTLEAYLCEAGASRSQAKAIVGHGLHYLARCEAEGISGADDSTALRKLFATPSLRLSPKG